MATSGDSQLPFLKLKTQGLTWWLRRARSICYLKPDVCLETKIAAPIFTIIFTTIFHHFAIYNIYIYKHTYIICIYKYTHIITHTHIYIYIMSIYIYILTTSYNGFPAFSTPVLRRHLLFVHHHGRRQLSAAAQHRHDGIGQDHVNGGEHDLWRTVTVQFY